MNDDTREFSPFGGSEGERPAGNGASDDPSRKATRFGYAEPADFDPTPPPLLPPVPGPAAPIRPRGRDRPWARAIALIVVAVSLLAAVAFERPTRRPGSAAATSTTVPPPLAVAVGTGPQAPKAFYCPEGSTEGTEEILTLVNTAQVEVTARLSFLVGGAKPTPVPVKIPAASRQAVRVNDYVQAQGVGTLVEADGPGLAVSETLFVDKGDRKGTASGPCAAQVASRWYFAGGTTARGYELWVLLVNPFPDDAVVDVVVDADGEEIRTPDFQQVPVPARSRVSLPLHEKVLRKERVATTVFATRGRVAAAESTFFLEEPRGASLVIGATGPSSVWYFGEGSFGPGVTGTVAAFNPGDVDADVRVELLPAAGSEPFSQAIKVPSHGRADLVLGTGLAPGSSFGVKVSASTPLVVARTQIATAPNSNRGVLSTVGMVAPQPTWIVPETSADPPFTAYVSVANPGSTPAHFRVGSLAGGALSVPANAANFTVAPGRRETVAVGDYFSGAGLSLIVLADAPVVVESAVYLRTPRYGSTASPALPVDGTLVLTERPVPAKPRPVPAAPSSSATAAPGATATAGITRTATPSPSG